MPENIVIFMGYGKEKTMLSKKMEAEFNAQINKEMYSAYLYLAMSTYCANVGCCGYASWLKAQANEEMEHAMKMYDYVLERGGEVVLEAIEKPQTSWNNILDVCENVLKHEQYVTSCINHLMDVAVEEKDYASNSFLTWYVNEQIEEEANADELCKKTRFAGDDKNAILLLNEKLAERK